MTQLLSIRRYRPEDALVWNDFVQGSANGTFLHDRRFMEYHADRFEDHSLIIEDDAKVLALLPANRVGAQLISHGGLTYGGFIVGTGLSAAQMLEIITCARTTLPKLGIDGLRYKPVPHIFHQSPVEQDIYALIQNGAAIARCDLSSAIKIQTRLPFSKSKRQGVNRAMKAGIKVVEQSDLTPFWDMLNARLSQAHDAAPTHSLQEIQLLQGHFPRNIRLFCAEDGQGVQGGILVFDCGSCVHIQYMATTEEGRANGALDLIVQHLLGEVFGDRQWLNFGISTTEGGRCLNVGLSRQKEMFGARSIAFSQYAWDLT